jgi:hypothetical protein
MMMFPVVSMLFNYATISLYFHVGFTSFILLTIFFITTFSIRKKASSILVMIKFIRFLQVVLHVSSVMQYPFIMVTYLMRHACVFCPDETCLAMVPGGWAIVPYFICIRLSDKTTWPVGL